MSVPLVYPLHHRLKHPEVGDVPGEVRRQLRQSRLARGTTGAGRIAVAVGSRGIANVSVIARAAVDGLMELGWQPFIVAAMGSHGGATAAGQRDLLASYGITAQQMGVPVKTEMDVVQIGTNSWNEPVYWDKNAFEADAVLTIARIKPHTDFHGRFESGIVKMLAIGLGKRDGAATHHQYGVRGLRDMIPESAKVIVARTKFAVGLAILENANERTAVIQAVDRDELFDVEPRLLDQARGLLAKLPFDQLDLLVVGELGKNYSGTGLDVNVIGREMVEGEPDSLRPRITRICVLDLSDESHGNAVGLGLADLTTKKLLGKMNEEITNVNYLTGCFILRAKIPIAFPTDRECIEMGIKTCWQPRQELLRMAVIPNTLELTQTWVTKPLADEVRGRAGIEIGGEGRPIPVQSDGSLDQAQLFPHCLRARRK